MPKLRIYILAFISVLLSWSNSFSQSELSVYSEDSTLFLLKVNTELVFDSLSAKYDLAFTSAERTNLVFIDSTGNPFLEKNVDLPQNFKRVYQLRSTANGWRLLITSEFELTQNLSREVSSSDALINPDSEIPTDSISIAFIITSAFKSSASPNLNDITAIDDLRFESEKLKAIKKLLAEKKLTANELNSLLEKISFEDKRADLIEQYSDVFTGNLTIQSLDDLFKLERYRSQAVKALGL